MQLRRSSLEWLIVCLGLLAGVLLVFFINSIPVLGARIPSSQMMVDYFVALLWCLGVGVYVVSLPVSAQERRDLLILWGLRCAVTLGAMLYYEQFYPLDAYGYFSAAQLPAVEWQSTGFGQGTQNMIALCWWLNHNLPLLNSYHALKVVFSFIGFMGCFVIYRAFCPFFLKNRRLLLYLFFLYPSMIFWSSIIGKDPVILFGIALYVYGALRLVYTGRPGYLLPLVLGIAVAALFRSWYLLILVVPLAALGIRGIRSFVGRLFFLTLIAAGAVTGLQIFAAQFRVADLNELVDRTQMLSHSWNYGGSAMDAPIFSGLGAMLRFAPLGMFTALFRPLPGEVMNPFGLLAGIENLFVLGLLFKNFKKIRKNQSRLKEPFTLWALSLVLVWSFSYSFISYQNLGAATRFRLQILPVLLGLILFLIEDEGMTDVRHRRSA